MQNKDLLATLEDVQGQRDHLLRLNRELEETNHSVTGLYRQLSEELEATNRGVVALYAELDEKSAQLREASEAKSRFLANVSHELRAPATAVIGLLRLLLDQRSDPLTADQRHQLDLARGSAEDLLALVNELLDLAKAESGRIDVRWDRVDLSSVFQTLRGTMQSLVTRPEVRLVVEEPTDLPALESDAILLTQILRNLLTNGIKFTDHGEVRLAATHRPEEGLVRLTVADTGPGIPPDEQEHVFEEFYQVRGAVQATVKGTGLGLPYARRLAGLLGGSLTLVSTLGVGSAFTVDLPTRRRAESTEDSMVVLVVDDDEAFRVAVSAVMSAEGARVIQAADGRSALAALAAEVPDVILLDLRLPEMDGAELLDRLGADDRWRAVPVIILTAYAREATRPAAFPRARAVVDKADTQLDALPERVRSVVRAANRPGAGETTPAEPGPGP